MSNKLLEKSGEVAPEEIKRKWKTSFALFLGSKPQGDKSSICFESLANYHIQTNVVA